MSCLVIGTMAADRAQALVDLCGGEPLVVREIFEVAERLSAAGILVALYTSGWPLRADMLPRLAETCDRVIVSVDGATAAARSAPWPRRLVRAGHGCLATA